MAIYYPKEMKKPILLVALMDKLAVEVGMEWEVDYNQVFDLKWKTWLMENAIFIY